MSDDRAYTPTRIAQQGPRVLGIRWADGSESVLDVRALRLACACARCVDEWSGEAMLDAARVPEDVHPLRIHGVGRYAIQIDWSDGHDSGIYPFRRLRELAAAAGPADSEAASDGPARRALPAREERS